ncbi:MAG: ACP S-malonyltransferase [Pseudomonadota bacterium]
MSKKVALLFPGQGSQSVGMFKDVYENFEDFRKNIQKASDVLAYDLWDIIQNGPEDKLNATQITQPALLACEYGIYQLLKPHWETEIAIMAGHSLGEYSALVCAGVLAFEDALHLVQLRGELMQSAVPLNTGAMAAILGLEDAAILEACQKASGTGVVEPANYNSPGQVVIAGNSEAVNLAIDLCKSSGAKKAMLLNVSVPSHCALMRPAADALANQIKELSFSAPQYPVINNVDTLIEQTPERIQDALIRQLYCPVKWTNTMHKLLTEADTFIECGPGKILGGLMKRVDRKRQVLPTNTLESLQALLNAS